MLKEMLYTGLGGAVVFKERLERELDRLETKGKLSREEIDTFMTDLRSRGEQEEAEWKSALKTALKEAADELGLATKADIEALQDTLKR